jgi:hypothetical protein
MQICTTKAQRHQERLRSSYPQISQKDADFEIQIGDIGVICGSLLPFLVSFRHWGGFKATCLGGEKSAWDSPTHHFEVDGLLGATFPLGSDPHGNGCAISLQLWSPSGMRDLSIRRFNLNPATCNGHTFRHNIEGGGLMQLHWDGFASAIPTAG